MSALGEVQHLHWVDQLCWRLLGARNHLLQELLVVVVGAFHPGVSRGHAEDGEAARERVLHLEDGFVLFGIMVRVCVYVCTLLTSLNE